MFYGYARVSTVEQVDGTSLDEQTRRIAGVAMLKGADIARMFVDAGVSGSKELGERPEGGNLLATLKAGDTLITSKLDRLFRNALDALATAEYFKQQGIDLIIVDLGVDAVTQNGVSKMFFGMLALMAEFERDRIKERQADGQRAKKEKGGFVGGRRPFGYRVEGTGKNAIVIPDPAEQQAIIDMQAMREAGQSYRQIAQAMNERGHVITHQAVKNILTRD
jgi:DNA invertase Pin-like site-specific DNA recombinase